MADNTNVMDRGDAVDFADSSTYHDRVFIVGNKKFHVNSGVLSVWSKHFRRILEGDFAEASKKEIEIKEVEPELFNKYLLVLYYNTCELEDVDLIPLIHLSYRFLTPHVLEFCKKFIEENLENLGPLKLELLKTSCIYGNKDIKNKLAAHFMNDNVMNKFKCEAVTDIVVEYNLIDLKAYLGGYMIKNVTYANCVDLLESSLKLNLPTLKEGISKQIDTWKTDSYYAVARIPRELLIDLTKAAFKHDLHTLKNKLRYRIVYLNRNHEFIGNRRTSQYFLSEYYDEIMELPENIKKFIILASVESR